MQPLSYLIWDFCHILFLFFSFLFYVILNSFAFLRMSC